MLGVAAWLEFAAGGRQRGDPRLSAVPGGGLCRTAGRNCRVSQDMLLKTAYVASGVTGLARIVSIAAPAARQRGNAAIQVRRGSQRGPNGIGGAGAAGVRGCSAV